jgi:L-Ala-D/L-Glu epimerase
VRALSFRRLPLQLRTPFRLAHGTSVTRENVLVELTDGEHVGRGEAAVVPYLGETVERVLAYLADPVVHAVVERADLPLDEALDRLPPGSLAARAALDMALHDLWGQAEGRPLHALWGLSADRCPSSSVTVAMPETGPDAERRFEEDLRAAGGHGLIKLKLGSGRLEEDLRLVTAARRVSPSARLCVDANGGWSAEQATAIIPRLAAEGVLFVEQPLAAAAELEAWRELRAALPAGSPPLVADESAPDLASLDRIAGVADGINVKLAKHGGLRAARRMIDRARSLGLRVLIGCMIESSLAVTAAAQLAPLADWADLDGPLLIVDDPFRGVLMEAGRLLLPAGSGLGVTPRNP